MPYLEYLFCEDCGNQARLDLDPASTLESYSIDGRKNPAILQPTFIWDYLIYSCGICGKQFKYTYRDVERRVRHYFSSLSLEYKDYFDKVVSEFQENSDELSEEPQVMMEFKNPKEKTSDRIKDLYTAKT